MDSRINSHPIAAVNWLTTKLYKQLFMKLYASSTIFFALLGVLLPAPALWAQDVETRVQIRPVKISTAPVIDGVLDDSVWLTAAVISDFKQIQPVLGVQPSERTEVYLAYDDDYMYVAFRAFDSDPGAIVATEMRRDGELDANDHMSIFFDTYADRRNAFVFQMNPAGAIADAKVENNTTMIDQWNGIWDGAAKINEEGWAAELAIPFKTLSFDPANDTWGMDIVRRIRRKGERMRWANISQNRNDLYAGAFGNLVGLTNMNQGRGLEIVPTFSVVSKENHFAGASSQQVVAGSDVTYRLTSTLTAKATINSDFSDAPVDQVQNNLGRFSLFYPETRDFFLSDADIFQFGGLNQENGIPFFSRRMGILNTGETADLKFGGKITGRIGNLNMGVLNTQIEGKGLLDSQNLSVIRGSAGVLNESRVGFIYTDGDANSNNGSSLFGLDAQYRNSFLPGDNVIVADAWVQKSENPGLENDNMAYGVKVDYPNDKLQLNAFIREIQPNFAPKLGFVNQSGIRHYESSGRFRKRFDGKAPIRIIDSGYRYTSLNDMNGNLKSEDRILKIVEVQNQINDEMEANYIFNREVIDAPFQIARGIVLPVGDYTFERARFRVQTSSGRLLSGEFRYRWGNFWTGTVREMEGFVELRPSPKLFTAVNYQIVKAKLPQGDFDFAITRLNLDINLTPRFMLQNLVQHNSVSKTVGWNSRLRWEIDPGNVLFLVLNKGWEIEDGSYLPVNTNFTTKLRWTFRF